MLFEWLMAKSLLGCLGAAKAAAATGAPAMGMLNGAAAAPFWWANVTPAALAGGKAPAVAEAEPYGCSVKYAKK